MAITTEGFKTLVNYCTSTQSQSWFIKSMVESIISQRINLNEFLHILNSCSIEAFFFQQWDEFLFVTLKDVEELEADLMKFLFTRVKNLYFDSLVKENSDLKKETFNFITKVSEFNNQIADVESHNSEMNSITTDLATDVQVLKIESSAPPVRIQNLNATNSNSLTEIMKLQQEIEQLIKTTTETQLISQSVLQSKVIRFSQTRKHSQLQVSEDRKRVVVVGSDGNVYRNILGEDPLLPGNVYTWKLRYQGYTGGLYVGVIDESKFHFRDCEMHAHCRSNSGGIIRGCLSGNRTKWNPGELLEITTNLIHHTLTIKSVSNASISLTGILPRLCSGNYFPYALLLCSDHVLEIV
ncbi:hypothetical protein GEMRC1_000784 [Eukaryota sp. GEM-RC1]